MYRLRKEFRPCLKEIVTRITQSGRVTIALEVRRLLGLRPRDRVALRIEAGVVKLVPARDTLEGVAGSVQPAAGTGELEELLGDAKAVRGERLFLVLKMG
jgi:bifunctional DNA-binding transcriptional regulator/antitoxin component of YhaV-PrlF toxin-antitoxin module